MACSKYKNLGELDEAIIAAVKKGVIKLLDTAFLRDSDDKTLRYILRRQDLEKLEKETGKRIFMKPDEAAAALRSGDRRIGSLTYGWCSPSDPDPSGEYLAAVRRFLRSPLGAHVTGLFWDFASLPQNPRSPSQDDFFKKALKVMGCVGSRRPFSRRRG